MQSAPATEDCTFSLFANANLKSLRSDRHYQPACQRGVIFLLQVRLNTLTHRKDSRIILADFDFVLNPGDKAVLIGEEGNGKSTLLKWIYNPALIEDYADYDGSCTTQGEVLGYLPQELREEDKGKTVYEYISCFPAFTEANPSELYKTAAEIGFPVSLFYSDQQMRSLSGGERVKVQMAQLLLSRPDILLLDEPSNDIDLKTLHWLETLMNRFTGAVLYISHDETLIERTANRVILIEQLRRKSKSKVTVSNVPFCVFTRERQLALVKQEQEAYSERREERKAKERFHRIEQAVESDLRNISRQDPHGGQLLKKKMKSVKALEKRYDREHSMMTEMPEAESPITIRFGRQKALPAGKTVIDFKLPELETADGRILSQNIELRLKGPEKICIVGENGAGKTTLIKKLAEELSLRQDLAVCYMPQNYEDTLPPEQTPVEFLAPSGEKEDMTMVRTYLGAMKYTEEEMSHPVRELSGGQKAKLLLLQISLTQADVLILDEPTRNFSPLSGPQVRRILKQFPGAILSVSHDRKFIAEVCDKVYSLTDKGLTEFEKEKL